MAWIYEKSATWRKMVKLSKQSSLYTAIFGVAFVGIPYGVGKLVMWGTNPEVISPERQRQLDAQRTVDHKLLARLNKERLGVLLKEMQDKSGGDARYAAALRGESLGTQSSGSSARSFRGIRDPAKDPAAKPS